MWNWLGSESMGPNPPALCSAKKSSSSPITSMKGAEKPCRKRMLSTPRHTTNILSAQNPRKHAHTAHGTAATPGQITTSMAKMAWPPIHD